MLGPKFPWNYCPRSSNGFRVFRNYEIFEKTRAIHFHARTAKPEIQQIFSQQRDGRPKMKPGQAQESGCRSSVRLTAISDEGHCNAVTVSISIDGLCHPDPISLLPAALANQPGATPTGASRTDSRRLILGWRKRWNGDRQFSSSLRCPHFFCLASCCTRMRKVEPAYPRVQERHFPGVPRFRSSNCPRIASLTRSRTKYVVPTYLALPWGIVTGPDGTIWLTESYTNKIGRLSW
jgi:hypothetical protein